MYSYDSKDSAMSILHDHFAFLGIDSSSGFTSCRINLVWKGFGNFSAGAVQDGFYKTMLELALSSFYRIEFIWRTLNNLRVRRRKNKNINEKYF